MRKKFMHLIAKETENAKAGTEAWMFLKMNSLTDIEMIQKLYDASKAGVKIRMIIRSICSLIPGIKDMSENIEIISIVDKYLEHSRVFIFCHGGDQKVYLSSADWMPRNLDHRSEVAVPVNDPAIKEEVKQILELQWQDTVKARVINAAQDNQYRRPGLKEKTRAQDAIYKFLT
jgi:polyphosphate kinase